MRTQINPYQAPEVTEEEADPDRKARDLVRPPTLGLIILAAMIVVGCVIVALMLVGELYWRWHRGSSLATTPEFSREGIVNGFLAFLTWLGSVLTLYGAWQMRRFRSRRWAYAAAILALVPQPFWIVTAPFGVWSIIVLRHPAVKEAFARQQNKQGVPGNDAGTP